MTTVSFHLEGSRIVSFQVEGHSGYAPEGADIVCAAITSAVRICECAINDVLGLEASVKVGRDASVTLKLPGGLGESEDNTCQTLLTALMLYCTQLHEEYPENLSVMEV